MKYRPGQERISGRTLNGEKAGRLIDQAQVTFTKREVSDVGGGEWGVGA